MAANTENPGAAFGPFGPPHATIGRIVHYRLPDVIESHTSGGPECWRAAIIVGLMPGMGPWMVRLRVFLDLEDDLIEVRRQVLSAMPNVSLSFGQLRVRAADLGPDVGCWRWPPLVS